MRRPPVLIAVVQGTSMLPALETGDIVVAVRWGRPIRVGGVAVANIDGRLVIKRVAAWDQERQRVLLGVESPFGWLEADRIQHRVVISLRLSTLRRLLSAGVGGGASRWPTPHPPHASTVPSRTAQIASAQEPTLTP